MIPKTPEAAEGPDQVTEMKAEVAVIEADLARYKRMFVVAENNDDEKRAASLGDKIATQEAYLKELKYDLELMEASLDEECADEPGDEGSDGDGEDPSEDRRTEGRAGEDGTEAALQDAGGAEEGRRESPQQEGTVSG
jgi:hypothetical protein